MITMVLMQCQYSILGIYLLCAAMYRLRMDQFLLATDSNFDDLFHNIRELQSVVTDKNLNDNNIMIKWNQCIDLAKEFKVQLLEFTKQESLKSTLFNNGVFSLTALFLFYVT